MDVACEKEQNPDAEDDFQRCLFKHWSHLEKSSFAIGTGGKKADQLQTQSAFNLRTP